MNFGQALEAMKRGHAVTRDAWEDGWRLRLQEVDGGIDLQVDKRYGFNSCRHLMQESIMAEDWKAIE